MRKLTLTLLMIFSLGCQKVEKQLSNDQIVEIYANNRVQINVIWEDLGEEATMRDAVELWLKKQ